MRWRRPLRGWSRRAACEAIDARMSPGYSLASTTAEGRRCSHHHRKATRTGLGACDHAETHGAGLCVTRSSPPRRWAWLITGRSWTECTASLARSWSRAQSGDGSNPFSLTAGAGMTELPAPRPPLLIAQARSAIDKRNGRRRRSPARRHSTSCAGRADAAADEARRCTRPTTGRSGGRSLGYCRRWHCWRAS